MSRPNVVLAALIGVATTSNAAPPEDATASPKALWHSSCGYCHGREAFAPVLLGQHTPVALTMSVVRTGATGMPPFHASEISDSALEALARWMALSKAPADPP